MTILESTIAPSSDAYRANRDGMLALIERMRALEQRTRAASSAAKDRFHKRGQLLPRERVALVLDPGSPFIELSTLAGYMFDVPDADKSVPGGGLVAGIGFVSGVRCMVSANDSGIDAGALQPYGIDKTLRVQELALENKLPYVQLVESAGANLLRYRVEDFVRGGNIFRNLARLSAAGLPVVTVTHGSSTAGGAYQTGLSDYIVMVRGRTRAFLAGPPLLKAATGEIATEEELGGAEMHTSISGLGDYLAEDDRDARYHGGTRMGPPDAGQRRASCAALRCRRTARHHADGPQAAGRHAAGDRAYHRRLRFHRIRRQLRPGDRLRPCPRRGPGDRHHHQ
jgi:geranyl-CoA carboxylase beta subunit